MKNLVKQILYQNSQFSYSCAEDAIDSIMLKVK